MSNTPVSPQSQLPTPPRPRSLSLWENLGFSLTGLLLWFGTMAGVHRALSPIAILVWIPGAIIGVLLNLQLAHLGRDLPDIAGGTPISHPLTRKKPSFRSLRGLLLFNWLDFRHYFDNGVCRSREALCAASG
jgi:hypothetical protein